MNDIFMDLFYYDRKNCEEMNTEQLQEVIKKGFLTKDLLKEVFMNQIEKEF